MELARPPVSAPSFWDRLYAARQDGWELGMPAPPLAGWLDAGGGFETADHRRAARIAVPGCGRGHDARLLAQHGCQVWGFDFAEAAIAEARALAEQEGAAVTYEQRDLFTLDHDYRGFFDGVWEYTCFCAIDPVRREEYVRLVHAILRAGGRLLACFYPLRDGTDGPPFPVTRAEIEGLFIPRFSFVETYEPEASVERRKGLEWMVVARAAS